MPCQLIEKSKDKICSNIFSTWWSNGFGGGLKQIMIYCIAKKIYLKWGTGEYTQEGLKVKPVEILWFIVQFFLWNRWNSLQMSTVLGNRRLSSNNRLINQSIN